MNVTSVAILIATLLLAACAPQITHETSAQPALRIGAILSLSNNDLSSISQAMQEGITLATEELNANGGVNGQPVTVVYEDDELDSTKASTASHKLLNVDGISVGLIAGANTAKAAAPVFEQAKTPLIVLWDVNQDLKDAGDYTYGIGFSTENAGMTAAEHVYTNGARTAAIIRHQDEWSQLIAESFAKKFEELGGTVVFDESAPVGSNDFRSVLLKSKNADAIYAPLVGQLDVFFRQTQASGFKGIVATGDSMTQDAINSANGAAEGAYFTNIYSAQDEKLNALEGAYKRKYDKDPELLTFTALGYDSVMVVASAVSTATSSDPAAIHTALYDIKDFAGAAGNITIHEDGFAEKYEPLFVVKNNDIVLVQK